MRLALALLLCAPALALAQAPTLSGLSPSASNNTHGAVAITFTGTNLGTATSARFTGPATVNVTSGNIAVVDAQNAVVVTPVNTMPLGTYLATITTPGGTSNAQNFTVTATAPEVNSVSPTGGGNIAPVTLTLSGANFTGSTRVDLLGPVSRTLSFNVVSGTSLTATVPTALPGGQYRLRVTSPTGPSNDDIEFRVDDGNTPATVSFTDQFGNVKNALALDTDQVFITVTDADQNTDPASQQSITVTVTDSITGDSERFTLVETGNNTGVFRNLLGVPYRRGSASPNDGTLQGQPGSTLTATFVDPTFGDQSVTTATALASPTASATSFTNAQGNPQFNYTIGTDLIFVTVTDADRNLNPGVAETVNVSVTDPNTGDAEVLTLTETGVNTGVFRNQTGLPSVRGFTGLPGNRTLETVDTSQIRATYVDPGDGTDTSSSVAVMHFLTPSTTQITDISGNVKASFTIGTDPVFVTVTDADANTNPNLAERINVTIAVSGTGDAETVTLVETGANTGVFRNQAGIASRVGTAAANGLLDCQPNSTITASYTDPHDNTDRTSATATMKLAPTQSSVTFSDSLGNPRSGYQIGAEAIFVTLTDSDRNVNPNAPDQVTVTLVDNRTGDTEIVTLTETGNNTGVFRNQTGLTSVVGAAANNDGVVQTQSGAVLSANYRDPTEANDVSSAFATMALAPSPSSTFFSDTNGTPKSQFAIGASDIFVTVQDADRNTDPTTRQVVVVTLRDSATGDSETLALTETGPNTGVFRNTQGFTTTQNTTSGAVTGNGNLEVNSGDTITASYVDVDNPPDTSGSAAVVKLVTPSTTFFSNAQGLRQDAFVIGRDNLFVTVIDRDVGSVVSPPPTVKQVVVSLTDPNTRDVKNLTLTEDPQVLGTFRNTVGFPMVQAAANPADTTALHVAGQSRIQASYVDPGDNSDFSSGTAVAQLSATTANVFFSDGSGNPVSTLQVANGLFVTVVDADRNLNASTTDTVTVTLIDGSTGDVETLVLTETGVSTGVFRNAVAFPMAIAVPVLDGILETADGSTVTANYVDPFDGEFQTAAATAQKGVNPNNPRIARFTDQSGVTRTQYRIADPTDLIFVTVQEPDANVNAAIVDQITVTVKDTNPAQPASINLVLTEIDPNTGRPATNTGFFRNQTGVPTLLQTPPILGATLDVLAGDFITIDYRPRGGLPPSVAVQNAQMVIKSSNSSVQFTDVNGAPRSVFTIGAEGVFVTLTDADQNKNPTVADTVTVSLVSTITGDVEGTVTLTETGPNTGVFRNTTGVPSLLATAANNDRKIETAGGAILTANYTDPNDPTDRAVATATMAVQEVPATRLEFRNTSGPGATTVTSYQVFTPGQNQVFVLVADADKNTDPSTRQTLTVALSTDPNPVADTETVTLTETGANTGVFETTSGVSLTIAPVKPGDGTLEVFDGAHVTAKYVDPVNPGDTLSTTATISVGKQPLTTVFFADTNGVPKTSYVAGVDPVFVQVVDTAANRNANLVETVTVTLSSAATGKIVPVTLTETSASSGVFRNQFGVQTAIAPATAGSVLDVAAQTPIVASYVNARDATDAGTTTALMKAPLTSGTIRFTDATGSGKSRYAIGDPVFVTVTDVDQNRDPTRLDTVTVRISSSITGDLDVVTLTETDVNSGVFRNTTGVPTVVALVNVSDTVIQTASGATLTASYVDPQDPTDAVSAQAQMVEQLTPAQIVFVRAAASTTTTAAFAIATDPIFVRVIDPDQLKDPTKIETVRVTVKDQQTGDLETLTLTEVGPDGQPNAAGVRFQNLTGLPSKIDLPTPGDGVLEATANSTITATYVDPDDQTDQVSVNAKLVPQSGVAATIQLTDRTGVKVFQYIIGSPDGVFVTVTDPAANTSASVRDTVVTSVFDTTTGDTVGLTLFEQPDVNGQFNSGVFRNNTNLASRVGLPPTDITTTLFTAPDSVIIASYLRGGQSVTVTPGTTIAYDPTIAKILTTKAGPNGQSCFSCHSDDVRPNPQGLLNLAGYVKTTRGGVSGNPIVAGNSQASLIVKKLDTVANNPFAMPVTHGISPGDPTLRVGGVISAGDLAILKAWIDQGAVSPSLPTSSTYDIVQRQVFTPSCVATGCHNALTEAGGIRLDNLSGFQDAIRFRQAAILGNGPGSRMVQVLVDPTLAHQGSRIASANPPAGFTIPDASARLLSVYLSQQYPGAPNPPLREYAGDVQPYFDRNCTVSGCHNGQDRAGGLSLASFGALMAGGKSGMEFNGGDVPPSILTKKIDKIRDPSHTALINQAFFSSQGPVAITSWVNQGAFPGAGGAATVPTGSVTDSAVMKRGATSGTIAFTDGSGQPVTSYQIAANGIFVTVTDVDQSTDPRTRSTLQVILTDGSTGDREAVSLTETTPGSSVFRNTLAVQSVVNGAIPGNGIIETINNAKLTATYTDPTFPETLSTSVTMTTSSRSTTRFVDARGLPIGTYFIGADRVIIEVQDADESGRGRLDAGAVTLTVTPTGDFERLSLVMSEITTRPGVFHSQPLLLTNNPTATRENGVVESVHQGQLTATYNDVSNPADVSTATALTRIAQTTSAVSFTDQFGTTKTSFQIGTDPVFVTVRSPDDNLSPVTTETVQVTVFNDQNGDSETLTLFETGKNTGIFRNRTGLRTKLITGNPIAGNNVLEVTNTGAPSQVVRAHFVDPVVAAQVQDALATVVIEGGSTVLFTDNLGNRVTRYTRAKDLIFVQVSDADQNKDPTKVETVQVTVTDQSITPPDVETLILTETGVNTGVFRNKKGLPSVFGFPAAIPQNGIFETRVNAFLNPGDSIEADYQDPDHPGDQSSARVELFPKNPADSDDDGMPDDFEIQFGLNPFDPTDANLDFDGDGYTNLEEFLLGTNPRDPFDLVARVVVAPPKTVFPGLIQLDGSGTILPRVQPRPTTFLWQQVNAGTPGHGPAVTLSDSTALKPTFVGFGGHLRSGADLSRFEFDLKAFNGRVFSPAARETITVEDVPPSPFAGIDQAITLGQTIVLNGRETRDPNDPETPELAYSWSRPVGSGGFNTTLVAPQVLPSQVGTYNFVLTATDGAGNSATSPVVVLVHQNGNHVPLASLPDRLTTQVGQTLAVDGSASADADPDDTLTYHWRVTHVPAGTGTVTPRPPDGQISKTNLVLPNPGYYELTLTVTDQKGNVSPPAVVGIVADFPGAGSQIPEHTPVASTGGNLSGNVNGTITLDGRASRDPDGGALTYSWTQVRGVGVALSDNTVATPTFVPLFPGVYGFELRVSDGAVESAPSRVFVTVNSPSQHVPVASASTDQVVQLASDGSTIKLDGSASTDADSDRLTYYWKQVSGPGIALDNRESARPTFFTRQFGTYVFDLFVFDGKNFSLPSRTTVQVNPFGVSIPVADAGPNQTAFFAGDPIRVTLDGSASKDPGGLALTYQWSQVDGPAVTLDPGPDVASPSFSAPAIGTYRFRLVVKSSKNVPSLPAFTLVTVVDGTIEPPLVKVNGAGGATATVTTDGGIPVTLDASASKSRTGGTLSFVWTEDSGPAVLLDGASSAKATFTPAASGSYVFSVAVVDSRGNQGTGQVMVLVGSNAPPGTSTTTAGAATSGGDPGVVLQTGGGSGGGCVMRMTRARHGRDAGADASLSLGWLALLWLSLLARRVRRRRV